MLRLAIWYESSLGRNDGNPLYVTAYIKRVQYFCEQLSGANPNPRLIYSFPNGKLEDKYAEETAKMMMDLCGGVVIEHLRPYGDDLHTYGYFDYNIWVDWGEDGLTEFLPYKPIIPKENLLYWASDTHLGYDYRLEVAKKADIIFAAQREAVERFGQEGLSAEWLPHCFDPLAYPYYMLASKKYDICFVGHINSENRIDFLDKMFKAYPNFYYGQRKFEQAARKYAESKVVLNKAMLNDINMRVFEALGSGSFLLTDNIDAIQTLFTDGTHLVLYNDMEEAIEFTDYYLHNDKERNEIALAGYEEVLKNHKISNRVNKILKAIVNKKEAVNV